MDLFEPLKRFAIGSYLRLLLRRLDKLEAQVARIASTLELQLKLSAIKANVPLSSIRDAEEMLQADSTSPASSSARSPMELLSQSPEDLAKLERAWEDAELRYGQGRVPPDLDLYSYAAKMEADNPEEEP